MRNKDKSQEEDSSLHSNASRYELSTFFLFSFFWGNLSLHCLPWQTRIAVCFILSILLIWVRFLKRDLEIANMPHPNFLVAIGMYCIDFHKVKAKWNFYDMPVSVTGIGLERSLWAPLGPLNGVSVNWTLTSLQAGLWPCQSLSLSPFAAELCALRQVT